MLISLNLEENGLKFVSLGALNTKTQRRDTSIKMVKYLAFFYLRQIKTFPTYVKNSKKLPNEF